MFGKKDKNTNAPAPVITARIETMPGDFYGGADPVIYQDGGIEKQKSAPAVNVVPAPVPQPPLPPKKPALPPPIPKDASNASAATGLQKPLPRPQNSSKLVLIIVLVLALFGVGAFAYFFFFAKQAPSEVTSPVIKSTFEPSPVFSVPTSTSSTVSVQTPTSTVTSTVRGGGTLTLPHLSYAPAKDDDSDSLTNSEEEVFQTDPEVWDSDRDGYYDGQEVANLYNPKGIAPQKIVDSGLVKEYINPTYQYRFYYPSSWRVDPVLSDFKDILVSADSGDYIEIRVFPKQNGISFASWFATTLRAENFSSFFPFENRFKVSGYKRGDAQVGFFETEKEIYSVVYFYGEQEKNAFPHVMNVVLQSFRTTKNGFDLPPQVILPGVSTSTPSLVSSSPVLVPQTPAVFVSTTPDSNAPTTTSSSPSLVFATSTPAVLEP